MVMQMQEEDLIRMNKVLRHRLRNSASGLKASMTFLAKELAGRMTPRELEYFPLIQQACDTITALTNRMQLFFAPVHPSPTLPLSEVLEAAIQAIRDEFPTTEFALDSDIPADRTIPEKDVLYIPLCEVLRNAAEAAPGRDVLIQSRLTPEEFTVRIADSGAGFSASDDPFLPFFTTKTRHLGLGLCIARKYVERLQGTIACTRDGEQSVVTITFPACPDSAPVTLAC
ncbi:MAG: HAMP domain-containing sensor histidine kinase [Kiritimatiellae bacterium]|nr:HAMP domain-containing sensor histidine kinase [Kiritimatiellia bacterium]